MAANTGLYGLPAGNRRVGTRLSPYTQPFTPIMTTELNGIGSAGISGASPTIDNTQWLDPWMSLDLFIATTAARSAGAHVAVYAAYALNGVDFVDVNASTGQLVAVFPLDAAVTARRVAVTKIEIDPGWFKLFAVNNATVALAASGNILSYRTYGLRSG